MIRIPKIFGMILLLICITAIITSCNTSPGQAQTEGKTEQTTVSPIKPENNKQISNVEAKNSNKQTSNKAVDKPQTQAAEISAANTDFIVPEVLGRPTDKSITVNVVPAKEMELYIEYGTVSSDYTSRTDVLTLKASVPAEVLIEKLQPDTRYYYRISYKKTGESSYSSGSEDTFMTQRAPGSTFTFDIQGDSHPERRQQFDPELYLKTMGNVRSDNPDFYMTIGDDFSVDTMKSITRDAVTRLYINQRNFLGLVGSSAPLFLVNGNHEQAAQYVLDGTGNNVGVWGQNARNSYFSQPAPDNFYTGDEKEVDFIGQLRDYYAWTWGDALFVVIDPYWHSSVPVDNALGGGEKRSDMWGITLGDEQYNWLKKTLEESKSKYKFVFTHHVLGTGRGGTDMASLYEWGGKGKNGVWEFDKKRPGWELPIHQLMAKNGVTIFFQGHDHVFMKQELDGVIYQTLPEPADPNYALYNSDAYKSDVKYPNSGHVRVTVSPEQVKVDYVRSALPVDEKDGHFNGEIVYSYTVLPK